MPFSFDRLHHLQLAIPVGGEEESRRFWVGILGFEEAEIREFGDHLQQNEIPVTWDGNFPGYERFYATDPFGNRLEFLQSL